MAAPTIVDGQPADEEAAAADSVLSILDDNLETRQPAAPAEEETEKPKPSEGLKGKKEEAEEEETEEEEGKKEEAEEKEEGEEEEEGEEGKSDPDEINTLADLAKEFDIDETELANHLQIPLDDGSNVPLSTVVSAFKEAPAAARIAQEVLQERETLKTRTAAVEVREEAGLRELAGLADALMSEVEGDHLTTAEWSRLEQEDKLEFLTKKAASDKKRGLIAQAMERLRKSDTDHQARQTEGLAEFRRGEAGKVALKHPEWVDRATGGPTTSGVAAAKQIDGFLLSQGYTQAEIDEQLIDARQIETAWQASEHARVKAKAPSALKRARKGPGKVLKRAARRGTRERSTEKSQSLRRQLAKTGSESDAAEAILDLGVVD